MRLKWAINLSLILTGVFLCVFTAFAQEKSLTIWLMPNEPPLSHQPSDNEISEFLTQNPNLINTPSELKSDRDFAKAVLGQTQVLGLINKYKQARNFKGNINLRILKWPQAFAEIESATMNKEGSPDIVQLGTTWTAYFANKNALMDISKYVDENMYFEPSIKSCKILGSKKIYALPLNVDVRVLYYWKNLINNPEIDLTDWDSFNKACKRIQGLIKERQAPQGMRWAIGFPVYPGEWDMLHQFAIWLWSAGGDIVKVKKILGIFQVKEAGLDSKETLETVTFLKELTGDSTLPELTLTELEEEFIKGEVGMIISGGWLTKRLKDKFGEKWNQKIGVMLPPIGPAGRFTFVGGCNLAIFKAVKDSANFNQSLDFVQFLCGRKAQIQQFQYSEATGALPGLKLAMDEFISIDPSYQIFKEALEQKHGKSYPSVPEWASKVEKEITLNNLYQVWQDIKNNRPEDNIKTMLKKATNFLNREFSVEKVLISCICGLVVTCILSGSCLLILWLQKRRIRKLNLEIEAKESIIQMIQSYTTQIEKLSQERERLEQEFIEKELQKEKDQATINKLTLELQKYSQKISEAEREIQISNTQIQKLNQEKERLEQELGIQNEKDRITIDKLTSEIQQYSQKISEAEKEIQISNTQIQGLSQEREGLNQALKEKEIDINGYQSKVNNFSSEIQDSFSKLKLEYEKNQELEKQLKKLKEGNRYTVTISYKGKELKGKELLEHLLNLDNVSEIKVEDNYNEQTIEISSLNQKEYEKEKKLFIFIAYFSYLTESILPNEENDEKKRQEKEKERYTSSAIIAETKSYKKQEKVRDRTSAEKIFDNTVCCKPTMPEAEKVESREKAKSLGKENEYFYSTETIKKWISRLRKILYTEGLKDLLPEHPKGYRINASVIFFPSPDNN